MNDDTSTVPLDSIAVWVDLYRQLKTELEATAEKLEAVKEKIQEALGDAEVGLIGDRVAVTWKTVSATRFDTEKAKQLLGDRYSDVCSTSVSRRFVVAAKDPAK